MADKNNLDKDALAAISANPATAYLQVDGNELRLVSESGESNKVAFQKVKNGLPILGNVVTVHFDSNGDVTRIEDDSTENLKTGARKTQVDAAAAIEVAVASLKTLKALGSESELVWFRMGNAARLAWHVKTKLAESEAPVSPTDLRTTVDAETGEILSQSQIDTKTYKPDPGTNTGIFPRRIVINDSVGPGGSQTFALNYPEVCSTAGGGLCTATLIAPNVVITARHCGTSAGSFVSFGPNSGAPIFSTTVQSSCLPAGAGTLLDGGDVAILLLNANVPPATASPMRLIDETNGIVGMTIATIGYGLNGVGSTGHQGTSDGLRWGGENVCDVFGAGAGGGGGANIFSTDFDDGSAGANTIPSGSATPLTNEATTAPGDSGGPMIVNVGGENLIAGVLSGGTSPTSVYGDISWWTGTSVWRSQIEAKGGMFFGDPPPPPTQATDGIVYDNAVTTDVGLSSQIDVVFPFESAVADDFTLATAVNQSVTGITFTALQFNDPPNLPTMLPVTVNFYLDDGTGTAPVYTGDGMMGPGPDAFFSDIVTLIPPEIAPGPYSYSGDFSSSVSLNSGQQYWISIQANAIFPPQFGWLGQTIPVGNALQGFPFLGTNFWSPLDPMMEAEMDFQLHGIDETVVCMLGDVDQNGIINLLDVAPFIDRLSTATFQCEADIDENGIVNLLDVGPFITILSGG